MRLVALAALTLVACGSGEPGTATAVVRDSGGIRIVENPAPGQPATGVWSIIPEASVVIGGGSTPETELYRVAGATRLPDGGVVIANAGTHELRFYTADGRLARVAGGEGEGAGEFRQLSSFHRFGDDSLLVYDRRLDRLSVFDGSGAFVRSFRLERVGGGGAEPGLPLPGGRLAASTRTLVPREALRTGVGVDSTTIVIFSMAGLPLDTVGRFPVTETFIYREGPNITVVPYPFARRLVAAASEAGIHIGWTGTYEIRTFARDGRLLRIVRRAGGERPATEEEVRRFTAGALADARSDGRRTQLRRIYREMNIRETLPAYDGFLVDADGHAWVQPHVGAGEEDSRWEVFGRDGRWLGVVEAPAGLTPLEVGRDYVLGRSEDSLGVESVRLHELVRGG